MSEYRTAWELRNSRAKWGGYAEVDPSDVMADHDRIRDQEETLRARDERIAELEASHNNLPALVRQPTNTTCGQACLAMILGLSLDDVFDVVGEAAMDDETMAAALAKHGFASARWPDQEPLPDGASFLLVVRSLNYDCLHYILRDARNSIFDPAQGQQWDQDRLDAEGYELAIQIFGIDGTLRAARNKPVKPPPGVPLVEIQNSAALAGKEDS